MVPAILTGAMTGDTMHVRLARLTRGGIEESTHWGSIVVADTRGKIVYQAGDPTYITFTRSTLKPFQAVPFLLSVADSYPVTEPEIAIICASHNAENHHLQLVRKLLDRFSLSEDQLACGGHYPLFLDTTFAFNEAPLSPKAIHNNCSGKHAAMLAACVIRGYDTKGYLEVDHPLQQEIIRTVCAICDLPQTSPTIGIDGCSAPNLAVPLATLATAYARLGDPSSIPAFQAPLTRARDAMLRCPFEVSGSKRSDLDLTLVSRNTILSKIGAEGVQTFSIPHLGLGGAIKIADGSSRARLAITISVLQKLNALAGCTTDELEPLLGRVLYNSAGLAVGTMEVSLPP
jgi:L-asparaginase II